MNNSTLVIQSHRNPLPYPWIQRCLDSVQDWAKSRHYDYTFLDDELFTPVPSNLKFLIEQNRVIASDLARLLQIHKTLDSGYDRVVWCDADFLIFDENDFRLPDWSYAVGREIWVQADDSGRLKVYKKVHNAFMMFCRENAFLDFYIETVERLLSQNTGVIPPQFAGPKLLTALHNVAGLHVMEQAGMLSPLTIDGILSGQTQAVELFRKRSEVLPSAVNLCISSCERHDISTEQMGLLIDKLQDEGLTCFK